MASIQRDCVQWESLTKIIEYIHDRRSAVYKD